MTKIEEMILAHSNWKHHLKKAIDTSESEFTVEQAGNYHNCAFGKWLDSSEGKQLPDYSELYELHKEFHHEASKVLNLALEGQKTEAEAKMQFGSLYSKLSSKLVNKLTQIKQSFA